MERIAIAGLSLRQVDVTTLEHAKRAAADAGRFAREVADELGASELVVLSTCNRLEIVFAREEGHLPCEQDRRTLLRLLALDAQAQAALAFESGLAAASRLFRVVCSLDSLVVGEDQILAQARAAFAHAEAQGMCGALLTPLFQRAFQVGKEVRTKTALARHPVSVVSLGMEHLAQRLGPGEREMCVLGAGHMARLAVVHAREMGFRVHTIASRSAASAQELASSIGARAASVEEFLHEGEALHALVSATSAPGLVLRAAQLLALAERGGGRRRLHALDLAMPRDLEPCADSRVELIDLDTLRARAEDNRKAREAAAREAQQLIEHKLASLEHAALDRRSAATVAEVHGATREIVERELGELCQPRFAALSAEQRREVEHWARTAFGRLEHAPIRAIKRWLEEHRPSQGEA